MRSNCLNPIISICVLAFGPVTAAGQTTWLVGPAAAGSCGGSNCHYQSIQAAVDGAAAGDTVLIYRRTDDPLNNECYNEHVIVDVPIELAGASLNPAAAACIGPSTGGDIIKVTSSDVILRDLELSGMANDGAAGTNAAGAGGRADGHGVHVYGDDIDNVQVLNCTINYTHGDNIRYFGDRDQDGDGFMEIRRCYLHHSDTRRNIKILRGGGSAGDRHVVSGNLIHTGQGVLFDDVHHALAEGNIVKGWAYWGHLAGGNFPETRDAGHGGGWRYYSKFTVGIWATQSAAADVVMQHNLVLGTNIGLRVSTAATLRHNTVVNPFNMSWYDLSGTADAGAIRDNTYGIMVAGGFAGTLENNLVVVTDDNRANGQPGRTSAPYYTPGISGYGIAFENNLGTLSGATIAGNNVWGFVDTDGATALNFGAGIPAAGNFSVDPKFALDTDDESAGGSAPCLADDDGTRCYELYEDNFFLQSTRVAGSCHADIVGNTAGGLGFVDMTSGGQPQSADDPISGLTACSATADAADSPSIDSGSGSFGYETEKNGDVPNIGAFGGTKRASLTPELRLIGLDAGPGSVKDGDSPAPGPGLVQPAASGLTELTMTFNRPLSAAAAGFVIRNFVDTADGPVPTVDVSGATSAPYQVTLSWSSGAAVDCALRIRVLGSGPNAIVDPEGEALDGDLLDDIDGPLPSGDGAAGGDAEFVIYALRGDVDGDRVVEGAPGEDDHDAITVFPGYPSGSCSGCPEDIDGDGDVDSDDLGLVQANDDKTPTLSPVAVSGTALANDHSTPLTGSARTISLRISGGAPLTTMTDPTDGSWRFAHLNVSAGDTLTVYLDGEAERGNLLAVSDGSSDIVGSVVVQDHVVLQADPAAGPLTITDLADYDSDDDGTNMLFSANGAVLTVHTGVQLYVDGASTFQPGGTVDVADGGIHIAGTWTSTAGEQIHLEGDWTLDGTFNAAGSAVTLDGSAATTFSGATTFFDLTCVTPGKRLVFPVAYDTTINGTLSLQGDAANHVRIASDSAGTDAVVSAAAIKDAGSSAYFRYIDVSDCSAAGSAASFTAYLSTDSGGNSNWSFPAPPEAIFCYDAFAAGWEKNPQRMADCNTNRHAQTRTDGDLQELISHQLESGSAGSGEILGVAVRYHGCYRNKPGSGKNNRAAVTPIFSGSIFGQTYDPGAVLTGKQTGAWIDWIDVTSDPFAPSTWTWTDTTNLDLDITAIVPAGKLRLKKVQLRVTYLP